MTVHLAVHNESLVNADPRVVTFWSDLGCPWATLALDTLRRAARERGVPLEIDHRVFPLELFNSMPTPKRIIDAEIVAMAGMLPELGWTMWFGPLAEYPVTMLPPMAAVQAAKHPDVGGLRASDQLDEALRRAYYVESRCISMPSVISEVALECPDLDAAALGRLIERGAGCAEIYSDFRIAGGDDVQGSPHLFTSAGFDGHNPGADYAWTAGPPHGLPRVNAYDTSWVDAVINSIAAAQ